MYFGIGSVVVALSEAVRIDRIDLLVLAFHAEAELVGDMAVPLTTSLKELRAMFSESTDALMKVGPELIVQGPRIKLRSFDDD